MTYYIGQRLVLLPFLLLVYSFVIFAIIQAPPGDFLTSYVATLSASGTSISAEQVQALRHEYGLDQSFIVQYLRWLQNLLSGNLDASTVNRLRDAAANLKSSSGDPGLDAVLSEIELRVEVELAKAGQF